MMIFTRPDINQYTIQASEYNLQDSVNVNNTGSQIKAEPKKFKAVRILNEPVITDTTSVCSRNSITDITFHDSSSVDFIHSVNYLNEFPFLFTEKNKQIQSEARTSLLMHLKPGKEMPESRFHGDWVIGIILFAAVLYSLITAQSKNILPGITRFFLFRGINDPASRDIGGLFHWQSTVINFVSFLVISLFIFSFLDYSNSIPANLNAMLFWLIILGITILVVTFRHIICFATGKASSQNEAFSEYLLAVYQSYRFSALFLFVITIMVLYTNIFHSLTWYISGITVFGLMYLIRITRLLVIFLNRKISIFYLILYLCALEILPVLITVKYFTGVI